MRPRVYLIGAGMDPATPACLIENGTLASQKQLVATLGSLTAEGFRGPAIVVAGDVVRFASMEKRIQAQVA
jgi:siroheme synthase